MRRLCLMVVLSLALAACGGGKGVDDSCNKEKTCPEGYSCDVDGKCVEAEPLAIATEQLPAAEAGALYEFTVEATGGIPPYHDWSLISEFEWLAIEPTSGMLSGTPAEGTFGKEVTVLVKDSSYDDGALTSKSFTLQVTNCTEEGAEQACYVDDYGSCKAGTQTCQDGKWTDCNPGAASQDPEHCGPGCGVCEPTKSDSCLGTCLCGDAPPCGEERDCCNGACVDVSQNDTHCGACDNSCSQAALHANGGFCTDGVCDYVSCQTGWLDCNEDRSDGCETEVGIETCGSCTRDCSVKVLNAEGVACVEAGASTWRCEYDTCLDSFADCDSDRKNGCETDLSDPLSCGSCDNSCFTGGNDAACVFIDGQGFRCGCVDVSDCLADPPQQCCDNRCFEFDDPTHCGSCDTDCTASALGPLCVDPDNATCGCFYRNECGGHNLCCDNVCTPVDADHCGDCNIACEAVYGGDQCDVDTETCYCEDSSECAGFGNETCEGTGTEAMCGD